MFNLSTVKTVAVRMFGVGKLWVASHGPEILVGAGAVIGLPLTAYLAAKATMNLEGVQVNSAIEMNKLEEFAAGGEEFTPQEYRKQRFIVKAKGAVAVGRLYLPAIAVGGLSIVSVLVGHNILRKRNLIVMGALATVSKNFDQYRGRVVAELGEEKDREFKYGITKDSKTETVVDEETGKKKKVTTEMQTVDVTDLDIYTFVFDANCPMYKPGIGFDNLWFLKTQEGWANVRLRAQGHLFLNDVLEGIGIPKTAAGQVVGWIASDDPKDKGVDFGLIAAESMYNRRDKSDPSSDFLLLNFNCCGTILDRI